MARKKEKSSGSGKSAQESAPVDAQGAEAAVSEVADRESLGRGNGDGSKEAGKPDLEALQEFFSHMPPDSGRCFVVVTHIRPGRDSILPELPGAVTRMKVLHAADSTRLEPNTVVIARDSLLNVAGGVLRPVMADGTLETTYHPIDHFFRSLADDQKEHAIGK